jgi:hypothetical protein
VDSEIDFSLGAIRCMPHIIFHCAGSHLG